METLEIRKGEGITHSILRRNFSELADASKAEVEKFYKNLEQETRNKLITLAKEIDATLLPPDRKVIDGFKVVYINDKIKLNDEIAKQLSELPKNTVSATEGAPAAKPDEGKPAAEGAPAAKPDEGKPAAEGAPAAKPDEGKPIPGTVATETAPQKNNSDVPTPLSDKEIIKNNNYSTIMTAIKNGDYDFNGIFGAESRSRRRFTEKVVEYIGERTITEAQATKILDSVSQGENIDFGATIRISKEGSNDQKTLEAVKEAIQKILPASQEQNPTTHHIQATTPAQMPAK